MAVIVFSIDTPSIFFSRVLFLHPLLLLLQFALLPVVYAVYTFNPVIESKSLSLNTFNALYNTNTQHLNFKIIKTIIIIILPRRIRNTFKP